MKAVKVSRLSFVFLFWNLSHSTSKLQAMMVLLLVVVHITTHQHTNDSPSMPSIFFLYFFGYFSLIRWKSSFKGSNQLHQKKNCRILKSTKPPILLPSPLLALWYRSLWFHFYCVGTRSYQPGSVWSNTAKEVSFGSKHQNSECHPI